MTDTNKQIDELENIFEPAGMDNILHNLAWNGTYNDAGQIVISDVAIKEAKTKLHDLIVRERLDEWDWIKEHSYQNSSDLAFQLIDKDDAEDRIKSLEATLNEKGKS